METDAAMQIPTPCGFPQLLENSLEDSAFSPFPQARRRAKYQPISAAAIHLKTQDFLSEEWGAPPSFHSPEYIARRTRSCTTRSFHVCIRSSSLLSFFPFLNCCLLRSAAKLSVLLHTPHELLLAPFLLSYSSTALSHQTGGFIEFLFPLHVNIIYLALGLVHRI